MIRQSPNLLSTARGILRALTILNAVAGIAFVAVLGLTVLKADVWLRDPPADIADPGAMLVWVRMVLMLSLAMVPLAHLLFTRLSAIVRSVETGSPFTATNAARMKVIAWTLLALQVLDLGFGVLSYLADRSPTAEAGHVIGWSPGLTGWLAVLLLFVLAHVFERGAAIEDELAGTV